MGQSLDKSEKIKEICNLNSGLKDYLLLQKKDFKVKSIFKKKAKCIENRNALDEEKVLIFTLSLALNIKTIQSNNCNFNSALLISKIKENCTEEDEKFLNQQIQIVENINEGKKIFKNCKNETGNEKKSDKFSNFNNSINDYETIDIKNNKSNFLTLNNSLEKNFLNNNAGGNTKKNLQNLEISKINTNKTANQTNIIDDDFGFDDYLKSDTARVKTKLKIDNYLTQFESTHSSKKEFSSKNDQNQVINDKSFENSKNGSNNKITKIDFKDVKKITIQKKNTIALSTSKGNNSETNNSNHKSNNAQNQGKSKPKLLINTSHINNSSNNLPKTTTNKQNKIEKKPVVNIKIDLRDIVREDIIDSYIQNTNSISNNSNIKSSVSPVNRYGNAPFTSKNVNQSTPTNQNFKSFVENCSNPNKKNFHLENPKKILIPTSFKKVNTVTNLNLAKSKEKNIRVKEVLNDNNTKIKEKSKGLTNDNFNVKNMNNNKGQFNKSDESPKENSRNNFKTKVDKKMVCLDISEDGDIIDNTKKNEKNDYIFTPENKVKYQFKPKNTKIIKSEENNNSFGRENSASFN